MATEDEQIASEKFFLKLERLSDKWRQEKASPAWNNADALCIVMGSVNEDQDIVYKKSSSLHYYLFGSEFVDTILLLTQDTLYVFANKKRCSALSRIAACEGRIRVKLIERPKEGPIGPSIQRLTDVIQASGHRLGTLVKEFPAETGEVVNAWKTSITRLSNIEQVDIDQGISCLLAVKTADEIELVKLSCRLTNKCLQRIAFQTVMDTIDKISDQPTTRVTHDSLSNTISDVIRTPAAFDKSLSAKEALLVEECYAPLIQSGGVYDLKASASPNSSLLSIDVVLLSIGLRYNGYCSNICRTILVYPTPQLEDTYKFLLEMHITCLDSIIVGNTFASVYTNLEAFVASKRPLWSTHLPKNLGFVIGIDFRDGQHVINAKSGRLFAVGMVLNLCVGLENVQLTASASGGKPSSRLTSVSMMVSDTVLIETDGHPSILTPFTKDLVDMCLYDDANDDADDDKKSRKKSKKSNEGKEMDVEEVEEEEEEEEEEKEDATADEKLKRLKDKGIVTESRLRDRNESVDIGEDAVDPYERKRIQLDLMKDSLARIRDRINRKMRRDDDDGEDEVDEEEDENDANLAKELTSYGSSTDFPSQVTCRKIFVDVDREVVLCPINSRLVPFHISSIKSVVMPEANGLDDGSSKRQSSASLRINFYSSGQAIGKDVPQNTARLISRHEFDLSFVKELLYKSTDVRGLTDTFSEINTLKKNARQRELKKKQMVDLVEQEKLVRMTDQRVPRLPDIVMRPSPTTRKALGTLEAHSNGFRFVSSKSEAVDIMYRNIKAAFWQPCSSELFQVIIHIHLHNAVILGRKKQRDVQFFTEISDGATTLDGGKRSTYDPDEIEEEQRERKLRNKLNKDFKDFIIRVQETCMRYDYPIEFERPEQDLEFKGTTGKEMCPVYPTKSCIVCLTDLPFFVVILDEVEHVHFERVALECKNFDMVILFKQHLIQQYNAQQKRILADTVDMSSSGISLNKKGKLNPPSYEKPWVVISAIQRKYLDGIQSWLCKMKITYTEAKRTMDWPKVIDAIADDPTFYDDVDEDGEKKPAGWLVLAEEQEAASGSEGGGDSDYEASSSESAASSSSDDSESYADSDDSSSSSGDDGDGGGDDDDDEDEGEGATWDELEKKAAAADKEKAKWDGDDDDGASRKRKR